LLISFDYDSKMRFFELLKSISRAHHKLKSMILAQYQAFVIYHFQIDTC